MTVATSAAPQVRHPEGLVLKALLAVPRRVRPVDIARKAGVTRQAVNGVLSGQRKASPRIVAACRELGLPVEAIWPDQGSRP